MNLHKRFKPSDFIFLTELKMIIPNLHLLIIGKNSEELKESLIKIKLELDNNQILKINLIRTKVIAF